MKALIVDELEEPNYAQAKRFGMDELIFSPRHPQVTAAFLSDVVAHGYTPRLWFASDWYGLDGPGFARKVDAELRRIGWRGNAAVYLDVETHDPLWIIGCFETWRSIRPTRGTDWCLEAFQGGWVASLAKRIAGWNLRLSPTFYHGDMTPFDPASAVLDLVRAGIPADRIVGTYDAARLEDRWAGYAFRQGRLPA